MSKTSTRMLITVLAVFFCSLFQTSCNDTTPVVTPDEKSPPVTDSAQSNIPFFSPFITPITSPSVAVVLTAAEELKLATEAGQRRLEKASSSNFAQWENASLSAPQQYLDLQGRLICFRFAVENSGQTLGTITIGSSLYHNTLFELGTRKLPVLPSSSEISQIIQRDLNITVNKPVSDQPEKLLHPGLYNDYAVYLLDGKKVAIDLFSKKGFEISALRQTITTPEEYNANRKTP